MSIRPATLETTWLQHMIFDVPRADIEAAFGFPPQSEGDKRYGPCWQGATRDGRSVSVWDRGGAGERGVWSAYGDVATLRGMFGASRIAAWATHAPH